MSAKTKQRAFIVMPFGKKKAADGAEIDFDRVYAELIRPAVEAADLIAHRADAERRAGSIHADMFQELLLAELVVADLTIDNPNVWYELGVRDALRASGSVMLYALRDRLPFDVAGQRMQRYTLAGGVPDPARVQDERAALTAMLQATMDDWRGRRASPVYAQLPNLAEPDWRSLKLGAVNEFWQGLEQWQERVRIAVRQQRPADVMVLADDTPNRVLEFEALRTAAEALIKLNRPSFALGVLQRAAELTPDDRKCRQLEAIALGRTGRYDEAREKLTRLAEELGSRVKGDGETLGLLARSWKDDWTRSFDTHPLRGPDPLAAARDTAGTLRPAAEAYAAAFTAAPADYYPGINALSLGRLWEHIAARKSKLDLDGIAGGVRWAVGCALGRERSYWALVTRAELALLQGEEEVALEGYGEAAALAYDQRDRFALDSSRQTLSLLHDLQFRVDLVAKAATIVEQTEQQLARISSGNGRAAVPAEPAKVILFSGHMIDDPKVRGPDGTKPARFPAAKVDAAATRIAAALDELGAGPGDLGICGGACGGDLLFAQACLARGMRVELRLAQPQAAFLRDSVTFADPDHRWERAFADVAAKARAVLVMDEQLGPAPKGVDKYDRCNRWMLYTALAHGVPKVSFVTLWDGNPGDGPGGTEHMANLVNQLTGRRPIVIDTKTL